MQALAIQDYNCPICMCIMSEPVSLGTCPHSLCKSCLENLKVMECPLCRIKIGLSRPFPVNLMIRDTISKTFPEEYKDREEELNKKKPKQESVKEKTEQSSSQRTNGPIPRRVVVLPPSSCELFLFLSFCIIAVIIILYLLFSPTASVSSNAIDVPQHVDRICAHSICEIIDYKPKETYYCPVGYDFESPKMRYQPHESSTCVKSSDGANVTRVDETFFNVEQLVTKLGGLCYNFWHTIVSLFYILSSDLYNDIAIAIRHRNDIVNYVMAHSVTIILMMIGHGILAFLLGTITIILEFCIKARTVMFPETFLHVFRLVLNDRDICMQVFWKTMKRGILCIFYYCLITFAWKMATYTPPILDPISSTLHGSMIA